MSVFLPDTNVWKFIGKDEDLTAKFEKGLAAGDRFLVGPPALIELVRGLVRGGNERFGDDRRMFAWMRNNHCEVLDLTRPFMAKVLHTRFSSISGVVPGHYLQLIEDGRDVCKLRRVCGSQQLRWQCMEEYLISGSDT